MAHPAMSAGLLNLPDELDKRKKIGVPISDRLKQSPEGVGQSIRREKLLRLPGLEDVFL
jgi:hypothetical protein